MLGLLCATACGGGGGGTELSPLTLTIDPPSMDAAWRTGGQTAGEMHQYVDVTVAEPITESIYVGVEQDDPVLDPVAPIDVRPIDDSTFAVTLSYNAYLAPGSYSGKLRLLLCGDLYCRDRHRLTGNEIPYTVEVVPGIVLTAELNGAPATVEPVDMTPGAMVVKSTAGDRLWLGFSEAVDMTPTSMWSHASATSVLLDDTSWEGTVACQPDPPIFPTGTLWWDVRSRTGPQAHIDLRIGVRP